MCGRFSFDPSSHPGDVLYAFFGASGDLELRPRFNIAPGQQTVCIHAGKDAGRTAAMLRWGLVPHWAKDATIGNRMINARSETAAEKPAFRDAFRAQRCLVPADGFYEWRRQPGGKQPYRIARSDGDPFAMAGLWESWKPRGDEIPPAIAAALRDGRLYTFTVLTTDSNAVVEPIHDRMPVILGPEGYDRWLDPAVGDPEELGDLLAPAPADELRAYPVSTLVNNPSNDVPACIEPLGTEPRLF